MRWSWVVACVCAFGVSNAAATIFRCAGADGEVLFTDVACPNGHPQPTRDINAVEWTVPEAAAPSARVQAGSRTPNRGRTPSVTSSDEPQTPPPDTRRARASGTLASATDAAVRRCAAARDRLDAVRATMRRGYKASSAARLDARLHAARDAVERDCAD
jgi:hypothetical protein